MIGILQVKDVELIGCVHEIPTFGEGENFTLIEEQVSSGWVAIKQNQVQGIINPPNPGYTGPFIASSWDEFTEEYGLGDLNVK